MSKLAALPLALALVALCLTASRLNAAPRPIEEFLAAQGTYCIDDGAGGCFLFVPPAPNYIGWFDPITLYALSVDYAGLANAWIESESGGAVSLGTTMSGSVNERSLPDGRAEGSVVLHTRDALTWAIQSPSVAEIDFAANPLLFGCRAHDVLDDGQEPALGECTLKVKFLNPAPGAPLPDLMELFIERFADFISISIVA